MFSVARGGRSLGRPIESQGGFMYIGVGTVILVILIIILLILIF
jgi:hypothetical protein